jgi:hypothetical protein
MSEELQPRCVLLADRHHGLSEGIRGLLETAFSGVFMVADELSLIQGAEKLSPTLVVLDVSLAPVNLSGLLNQSTSVRLRRKYYCSACTTHRRWWMPYLQRAPMAWCSSARLRRTSCRSRRTACRRLLCVTGMCRVLIPTTALNAGASMEEMMEVLKICVAQGCMH